MSAILDGGGPDEVVAVSGGRIDHGRLVLAHPSRSLTTDDLAVLARTADVAAICPTQRFALSGLA